MKNIRYIIFLGTAAIIALCLFICLHSGDAHPLTKQKIQATVFFCGTKNTPQNLTSGKEAYNTYCTACHRLHATDNILHGFSQRMPEGNYFHLFITQQDSLLKTKDIYARNLKTDWDTMYVHAFKLTKKDTDSIKGYLEFAGN